MVEEVQYASVDELVGAGLDQEDFELPDGQVVRIRALSRFEVMSAQRLRQEKGLVAVEVRMISCALVEPEMSEPQVVRWLKSTRAGYLEPLTRRINRLSGLGGDEVDREIADEFRGGSDAGVGDATGAAVPADGG